MYHKNTLTRLNMDMSSCFFETDPLEYPTSELIFSYGNMSRFMALKYLAVDLVLMEDHKPHFLFPRFSCRVYVCFVYMEDGVPRYEVFDEQIRELMEKE